MHTFRLLKSKIVGITSLIGVTVLILIHFGAGKKPTIQSFDPPGTVKIDTALFMDQSECTNFHWLEYLYWINRIYGKESPEYISALPDTTLWDLESEDLQVYKTSHFRHPAYRDYPIVGLTYQQMKDFCNWRSDRVCEYMLIQLGKIERDTNQTAASHFTIEGYLNGSYGNYQPNADFTKIPHYYLPSLEEWLKAEKYAQSIYAGLSNYQKRKGPDQFYHLFDHYSGTHPVYPSRKYEVKNAIYNLQRNVSEQLADSTQMVGDNWKKPASLNEDQNLFYQPSPSVAKGFRCAFQWKSI